MTQELQGLDFTKLLSQEIETSFLDDFSQRAEARINPFVNITPEDRLLWFRQIGYRPQGFFVPEPSDADTAFAEDCRRYLKQLEDARKYLALIPDLDARLSAYSRVQDHCERWANEGVPGRWEGQQAITRSRAQFRLVAYGRRGGKTWHASREAACVGIFRAKSVIWLVGPTMGAASRAFVMIRDLLNQQGIKMVTLRDTEQNKEIILENGSRFVCVTLKTVGEGRFKSGTEVGEAVDFAVIDEAAQIPPDGWTRTVLPPLMDRHGQALLLSSWEGEDEFFYAKAKEAKTDAAEHGSESDWDAFQAPSWEVNFRVFPQGRQTPMLQKAERETPPLDFLEQYGAIPATARSRVLPQFRRKVHVGPFPYDPNHKVILSCDPSFGANKYAVVAVQDYEDYVVIIDEYYRDRVTAEEVSSELRYRPWVHLVDEMIVDSAAPMEIRRWVDMGWPALPVFDKPEIKQRLPYHRNWLRDPIRFHFLYRQYANRILLEEGYEPDADLDWTGTEQAVLIIRIEEMLADDKLTDDQITQLRGCSRMFIDEGCVNTIYEHENYRYPPSPRGDLNVRENPLDKDDHLMDCMVAGTMIQTDQGERPIEVLQIGDRVATRNGYRRVAKVWDKHPASRVVTVHLSNGRSLTGTPDHKVWTETRGWVSLNMLHASDILVEWNQNESYSTASHTTATRSLLDGKNERTFRAQPENSCTGQYTRVFTDLFRRGITSITKIWTRSITRLKTLWQKLNTSIFQNTPSVVLTSEHALFAKRPTSHTASIRHSTALETVKPRGVVGQEWMTWRSNVFDAGGRSESVSIFQDTATALNPAPHMIGLEASTGSFPVFDLTVEGEHEFFAEGVLISNCLGYMLWHYKRFETWGDVVEGPYSPQMAEVPLTAAIHQLRNRPVTVGGVDEPVRTDHQARTREIFQQVREGHRPTPDRYTLLKRV